MSTEPGQHDVYLGLGSNIRPEEYLPCAINTLAEYVTVVAVSQAWETPPMGMQGANFLNAAAHIRTPHSANILKSMILRRIEALLGRVRTADKFADRTIDLDILVFDGEIVDPQVWTQPHIAVPLAELAPSLEDAASGATLRQVAQLFKVDNPQIQPRPEVFSQP